MISHSRRLLALVSSVCVALSAAMAPSVLAVPTITVTKDDGVPAATKKNPGDIVTYTNTITNAGTDATGVQFTDPDVAHAVLSGTVKISPVAIDDAYVATGNVSISIPAGSGVLANDFMGQNPAATITASSAASANGGVVSVSGDGSFTYSPPAGFTGADTFTYTLGNVTGSSVGTVTVTVSNMIWFINNTAAAGTGTLASPFNTLAAFQAVNDGVGTHPKNGDVIFIYTGSGNYTGGVTLRTNQKLIGQGASLSANMGFSLAGNSAALPGTGSNPTLANAGGAAITLGEGSAVFGTTVSNGTQTGIAGTVNAATIDSASSITTTSGTALSLGAGNGTVTIAAPITSGTGRSVAITGRTAGTVTLSGAISDSGTGISLTSNTGATIAFTGQITASTGTNTAFNVTGGGTVTATNTNSTLTSTTGITLNMASVSVGVAGLTFKSVSSNGAANGIKLDTVNCGAGGLNVIGDNNGRANGSGGSIANTTGGSLGNAPVHALSCSGTINLKSISMSLNTNCYSGMLVDNNASGTATVNVTGCTFTGVTASVVQNKSLLQFETGASANVTANVQNCFFNGSRTYGFFATGAGSSTLNVTVNQCGFGTDVNTGAAVNQPGSAITDAPAIGMGITNGSSALVDYTITNNTFWGANGSLGAIYAVTISGAVTTAGSHLNGSFNFNKIGKTGVTGSGGANSVAALGLLPGTAGAYRANVIGNDIRQVNSVGINFFNSVAGGTTVATLKCKGNTIAEPDTTGSPALQRAIIVSPGNSGGSNSPWIAEVGDTTGAVPADKNVISGGWQAGNMIRMNNSNNTSALTLPGLAPTSGATTTQVNAYTQAANTLAAASTSSNLGTAGIIGGAPLPLMLAPGGVDAAPDSTLAVTPEASPVRHSDTSTSTSPAAPTDQQVSSVPSLILTQSQLDQAVDAAVERWVATGLTTEQEARLRSLHFEVAALQGLHLGEAMGKSVRVDDNAGGTGWFADVSPASDALFGNAKATTRRYTDAASAPAGRIDLLTTLMHEMGHTLGLADSYRLRDRNSIMYGHLTKGERRLPAAGQAKGATPFATDTTHFLSGAISIGTLPAGKSVTIVYSVQIEDPVLGGATQLSSQATVSGSNFSDVLSDDPNAVGAANPTVTLLARPPTTVVSLTRQSANPNKNASVTWQIVFADPVDGLTASNFSAASAGVVGAVVSAPTETAGPPSTTWNISANTGTGDGTLGLNFVNDTGMTHEVVNAGFPGSPVVGQVYTIDKTAPLVSSIVRQTPSSATTNADVLVFRVTFNEAVSSVGSGSFIATGTTTPVSSSVSAVTPNLVFDFTFDGTADGGDLAALNGTVGLNIAASPTIQDLAGNLLQVVEPAPAGNDQTYTLDNTVPTVAMSSATGDPTTNAPIPVTVQFSEEVLNFIAGDIVPGNAAVQNFLAVDGDTYTFNLVPTGPGVTATANIAADVANDAALNGNTIATQFSRVIVDQVGITATTATAVEGGATGLYTFTRGASSGALTVSFQLDASSTATAATDFNLTSSGTVTFNTGTGAGTIVIPNGQLTATVTLTALTETVNAAEAAETARLNVVAASGYVPATAPNDNATVTITENGFLVTTTDDSGTGTLRQAILNANSIAGTDTITFSDGSGGTVDFTDATADTITLTSGQLTISSNATVQGTGSRKLAVSGNNASRVFQVAAGATVRISSLTVTGGTVSTDGGGGIQNIGTLLVLDCAITSNSATGTAGGGGLISGAISQTGANTTVVNSTFSGNSASIGGGTNTRSSNTLTLINCTFSGNSATPNSGGAVYVGGPTSIINSTLSGNSASFRGGAIATDGDAVTLANSIVAGNTAGTGQPDVVRTTVGSVISNGGNLIGDGQDTFNSVTWAGSDLTGTTATPIDPLLGPLADNGGLTQTRALLAGSPALNAGLNAQIPVDTFDLDGDTNNTEPLPFDQRGPGFIRAIGTVDIGAFELQKSVSIGNLAAISEGNSGTTNFVFTITRTGDTTGDVNMTYTVSGAAVNGTDFVGGTLPTGTATVTSGNATTTVTIPVSGDTASELSEAFTVTLTSPDNGYVVSGAPATSTITNDDTLSVTINQAVAQADPSGIGSAINFTAVFSEAVTDFDDAADVTLTGTAGATTTVITGGPTTYNIAVSGMTGSGTVIASLPATVALSAGSAANAASTSTDNTVTYDGVAPALASLDISDTALKIGDTATVTFTFSEPITGFTTADLTVANGSFPSVSSGDGGTTWTGTLTPAASIEDPTNVITLANTGYIDAAGNAGVGTSDSGNYAIDTARPALVGNIAITDTALKIGDTATVTFVFTEAVTGFTTAALSVDNGSIPSVSSGDGGITWTGTLTPTASIEDATNILILDLTGVIDSSGNAGTGTSDSGNYAVDTVRPALASAIGITDTALKIGDTATVTFTFTEAVTGFDTTDLTVPNGSIPSVTSGDGGITWTGTLTPTASIEDATNLITLANTGYTDAAGNAGSGTSDSGNYAVDTVRPALASAISITDTALKIGDTATVSFTFTEAVTGFDTADLTIENGSIPSVSSGDGGITWTGTLTPTASIEDTTNVITLNLSGVEDAATNAGTGTADSLNYAIDTVAPTVVLTSPAPDPTPNVSIAVTAQFSETVVGFVAGSVTVANATLDSFVAVDADTYTFNLIPTGSNLIVTADITAGATQDTAGNSNIAATQFARTINAAPLITVPGGGSPVLYGISNGFGTPEHNQIYEINPATGAISNAHEVTLAGFTMSRSQSLTAHPTTGVLYAGIQTSDNVRRLVTIDPVTGTATEIGPFTGGLQIATLAFKPDGTLLGVTGNNGPTPETMYTISTLDASATLLLALGNGADGEAIAFHPNGLLYHSSGNSTALFESVDLTTNVVTPIGSAPGEMFAMGYYTPTMQLLGSDISSNMFSIDIATGARTPIGNINGLRENRGLAVVVPSGPSLTRIAGSLTGLNSTVATVSDAETAASALVVTATTIPPGIQLTNLTNTNGTVTADVFAPSSTAAGLYTVVLNVTDGAIQTTANLVIEVVEPVFPPTITTATTNEDTQTTSGLVITANSADGDLTTHYKVTGFIGGFLYKNDGVSLIATGEYITKAEGLAGLRFTPNANANDGNTASFGFSAQAATSAADADLQGSAVSVTVTVNPVADLPSVTNATTVPDTQTTSGLVIAINAVDGKEVTHFKISNILNGTLFQNDGTTAISNGSFITVAEGGAGLKFTPTSGFTGTATFDIQAAVDNAGTGLSGTTQAAISVAHPAPGFSFTVSPMLNLRTGLFEQTVTVTNSFSVAMSGLRLTVVNLPSNVILYNRTHPYLPVIEDLTPLPAMSTRNILVQFYTTTRTLNFVPDYRVENLSAGPAPLPGSVAGQYHGLVDRSTTAKLSAHPNIGMALSASVAANGVVTGSLTEGVVTRPFSGKLTLSAADLVRPQIKVTVPGTNLELKLFFNEGPATLDGSLSVVGTPAPPINVSGWRRVWRTAAPANLATAYRARHNVVLENQSATGPQGYSYASVSVTDALGNFTVAGRLADGSVLTGTSFVGPDGQVRIYKPLYGNRGSALGTLVLNRSKIAPVDNTVSGALTWLKPAPLSPASTDTVYRAGFGPVNLNAEGGFYTAPPPGLRVMGLPASAAGVANEGLAFTLGGLDVEVREFTQGVRIFNPSTTGRTNGAIAVLPNGNTVSFTSFTATTGVFVGTFKLPAVSGLVPARTVTFYGQIAPSTTLGNHGFGYFLLPQIPVPPQTILTSPKLSGRVEL